MLLILNCLISAACTVLAATGLLTERLKNWQYSILMLHIAIMTGILLNSEKKFGIPAIIGLLILIALMVRHNRAENVCLACMGYLIEVVFNNTILFLLSCIPGVSIAVIAEEYYLYFSLVFFVMEGILIYILRKTLYKKIAIRRFMNGSQKIKYGLIWNLLFFTFMFITNIMYGRNADYSSEALMANCILFGICLLSSSFLIVECAKSIQSEEIQKAEQKQKELMQSYIEGMEYVLDEQRAFRHDYKNMLAAMAGFIREKRMEELETFFTEQMQIPIREIDESSKIWISLRNIYPIESKGFLYEKVLAALASHVKVHVNVQEEINIAHEHMNDLLRILGVLIDNAIEAAKENPAGKINLIIRKTQKGTLMRIENNFGTQPDTSRIFEKGYSTKGENRGNGLFWTKERLNRYKDLAFDFYVEDDVVIQQLEIMK